MLELFQNHIENRLIKKGSHPRALGYVQPKDLSHIEKWGIKPLLDTATVPRTPMAMGINWYTEFDTPFVVSDGKINRYFVAKNNKVTSIRGGHCVCIKSSAHSDTLGWWDFYDQGNEGACVGFGTSRMMTQLNRERYNARWVWDHAKMIDEWPDTNPGDDNGTSVHAGADVLRTLGAVTWANSMTNLDVPTRDALVPNLTKGISAARWATSIDDIRAVLQSPLNDRLQAIPFVNSWGRYYPHITWMPYTVVERLITEGGEFLVPTDR